MKFIRTNIDYIEAVGERRCNRDYAKSGSSTGSAVQQVLAKIANEDRYEIVNVTHFNTIEVRFFGSPYTKEVMFKNLQWCVALWEFTKVAPLHFDVKSFHHFIRTKLPKFQELNSFIDAIGDAFHPNPEYVIRKLHKVQSGSTFSYTTSTMVRCSVCDTERPGYNMIQTDSSGYVCPHHYAECSWCDTSGSTDDISERTDDNTLLCDHCYDNYIIERNAFADTDDDDGASFGEEETPTVVDESINARIGSILSHLNLSNYTVDECNPWTFVSTSNGVVREATVTPAPRRTRRATSVTVPTLDELGF
jgi:hypothetical protein